jgi:metal-dependent amidase/aminoacylase/carboxypeptidase family protein
MKLEFVIVGILLFTIFSCKQIEDTTKYQIAAIQTDKIFDSLVEIRRDLHKHPELSGEEKRTSKIIEEYLLALGLEVKTGISDNAVIGILNGHKKGKKIAWRADMDAIEINSADNTSFKSQNEGIGHMCGHDVHTTIGLGIANVLANQKENIEGTVYFIFQPSEETFTGAKDLIKNGLFDIIKPDEIYGLHIGPAEKGTISTKAGELFAYQKTIQITLKPETDKEQIKNFLTNTLEEFVRNNPNSSPWSLDYLTDPIMGLENRQTIYKDYFILQNVAVKKKTDVVLFSANILETDKEKIDSIPLKIKNRILSSKFKNSFISIEFSAGNPTVYNNPELTKTAIQTINSLYNKEFIKPIYGQIPYFNEDFIYYQQKVPGVMFLLGGSNIEKDLVSMPHSPDFAVDEETIKFGVNCFSSLILERVNRKSY